MSSRESLQELQCSLLWKEFHNIHIDSSTAYLIFLYKIWYHNIDMQLFPPQSFEVSDVKHFFY
jgi:hypothetical protein